MRKSSRLGGIAAAPGAPSLIPVAGFNGRWSLRSASLFAVDDRQFGSFTRSSDAQVMVRQSSPDPAQPRHAAAQSSRSFFGKGLRVNPTLLSTLIRQAARNVRHGGLLFVFATGMLALSLFALGVMATVLDNFSRVTDEIGKSVGAVAFLDVDSARRAEDVRARILQNPFVKDATLVPPEIAMARAKSTLDDSAGLLEGAQGVRMPWVVELSVDIEQAQSAAKQLPTLTAIDGVDEVLHPGGELSRVEALGRLLYGSGLFLALLIGLVVIVVVGNTVQITLFSRRDEIAIMKLVGATDTFIRVPFILEGLIQGLLSAALALSALYLGHAAVARVLEAAFSGALVRFELSALPFPIAGGILVAGAVLGACGAGLSLGRYLRV